MMCRVVPQETYDNNKRNEVMIEERVVKPALTPEQLEQLWADHLAGEFVTKDVEATLTTMVDDAFVNHVPVNTSGRGKDELRVFLPRRVHPVVA